jgi:outer membrane receptor protein involved in Fe transport
MIKNITNKHSRLEFRKSKLAGIISTIYVVLSSGTVLAQVSITKAVKHVGLERIEVTAQKRVQSIKDIPIAITAFSGDMIEDMGLNTSSELANKTPNLTIGQPAGEGGVVAVVMRGVGLSDFAPNNQAPIGLYVDGVVAGNSNAQITTLMDVERVEVLKGPQCTLYGRNTTGGTINVISRKPTADTEGYLRINTGNYGMRKIEGVFNMSLSDDLNIRLAVSDYHLDGYMENIVTGNEIEKNNTVYRLLVDWNVNNKWSVLFNLHGNNNDSDADLYNADSDSDFYKSSSVFDPKISTKTLGGSITINGELTDTISFTSITAYDDLDKFHKEDADVSALDLGFKSDLFNNALRLNSTFFYYDYQDGQIFNNINDPHYGLPAQRIINGDVSLYGFDGEFSSMATDSLSIIGSVGYVKSKYDESPIDPVVGELAIKGNQIQSDPEFSANIMANFEWELSDGGYVNAHVDVSYTDKTYFSPFEDDDISMGSYTISNLRVSWTNQSEEIEIAFWGKHLADKEVKTYAFGLRDVASVIENMRGAPRTFGV